MWKNDEDTLRKSPSLKALNAYLIKNSTDGCEEKGNWRGKKIVNTKKIEQKKDWKVLFRFCYFFYVALGNYSCLKVELTFTRDRAFYFTTVFIPGERWEKHEKKRNNIESERGNFHFLLLFLHFSGIILVTSSFITFWLEWNAVPARWERKTTLNFSWIIFVVILRFFFFCCFSGTCRVMIGKKEMKIC